METKKVMRMRPVKVKLPYKKEKSKNKNKPLTSNTQHQKNKEPKKKKKSSEPVIETEVEKIKVHPKVILTDKEKKERSAQRKAFKKAKQKEKYAQMGKHKVKKFMEKLEKERLFITDVMKYEFMLEEKRDRANGLLNTEDEKFLISDEDEDEDQSDDEDVPKPKAKKAKVDNGKIEEPTFPDSGSRYDSNRHAILQTMLKSKMEKMKSKKVEDQIMKKIKDEEKTLKKNQRNALYKEGLKKEAIEEKEIIPEPPKPKIVKTEGQFVFSHLASSNDGQKWKERKEKWKGKLTPTDMLKNVEKNAKKLEKLEKEGNLTKAAEIVSEQRWSAALKRAGGEKVKDDPILLKKTIKKQDSILKAKKKKWAERTERAEKQQEVRLKKRVANIQSRKDERKKKSRKVLRSRGRIE